jgi:proteasome-associated ATPase
MVSALRELRLADPALTLDQKLALIERVRTASSHGQGHLDRFFVEETDRLRDGLRKAREIQAELREIIEKLEAPPWHAARFIGTTSSAQGPAAIVVHGSNRLVVGATHGVSIDELSAGDEVLLSDRLNVIMAASDRRARGAGEIASVDRVTEDGRLVITARGEPLIVDAAASLEGEVKRGDQVRWDRQAGMAFERIELSDGGHLFLEETPVDTFDDIGGLDREINEVKQVIRIHFERPELARKYRVRPPRSLLLVGPPGNGKTMVARALANWIASLTRSGRSRFMNIPPLGLHSMWYAQSEANYRDAFRVARAQAETDPDVPVVMFFDEVDSIGAARGETLQRVDDRVLTAFMTELDGFTPRGNVLVVAATNRLAALDSALLRPGRLGDLRIEVPRPRMRPARAILERHLTPELIYAGDDQGVARAGIIDAAISRLYAPNAAAAVATLTFRDGKRRVVEARDLVNGAVLAKIASAARRSAWAREAAADVGGISAADVLDAVERELSDMAGVLTPGNCRNHLADLPQDVDVVRVEPIRRKAANTHRYLNVA